MIKHISYPCRGRSAKACSTLPLVEVDKDIVNLAKRTLGFDLSPKSGPAAASIAFESRNARMLVLDHAGNCSERSEEHTSELQSLMRISYAVFCLKKKKKIKTINTTVKESHHHTSTIVDSTYNTI